MTGIVTLWCAKPRGTFTQVGTVSNGSDWVATTVAFSPNSRFMVCISQLKPEVLDRHLKTASSRGSSESLERMPTEILMYDLDQITSPCAKEIDDIIAAALEKPDLHPSQRDVAVQDMVLAYVGKSSHVWLEEVVSHVEATMGTEAMTNFFLPRSRASSIHEIVMEIAARTVAFLSKSSRAAIGFAQPGEREADVMFRREEAVAAMIEQISSPTVNPHNNKLQTRDLATFVASEAEKQASLEVRMCMVLEWLIASCKLFAIVWNTYVFNTNASLDRSIAVTSNGRLATKVAATLPDTPPPMIWLNPPVPQGVHAEIEFLVEKWTAESPDDGLRIGLLQRRAVTRNGQQQRGKALDSDTTWMYGCGTGMRYQAKGSSRLADYYTKYVGQKGDKFAVIVDRARNNVQIKINGLNQGIMFDDIPIQGDLYLAVQFMSRNESVRIPEAFVTSGWCSEPRRVEIDVLEFKIT